MEDLLKQVDKMGKLAQGSKLSRLLHNPYKYLFAIFFRNIIYKIRRKEIIKNVSLFYGKKMKVALPASTDIYLTGGKSHNSEIRLAKFLIQTLKSGDHFLDIGAHYGYFSMLALELVGLSGKVYAFEPSSQSFHILDMNLKSQINAKVFKEAVSDKICETTFFEFPNLYSEYNATSTVQFEKTSWFKYYKPIKKIKKAIRIDDIILNDSFIPKVIKIDVEGSEYDVLLGATDFLDKKNAIIAMEYLSSERGNQPHMKAEKLLKEKGYLSYIITQKGLLEPVGKITEYLERQTLESDNIVFRK